MWNLLIGPIGEILNSAELPRRHFYIYATVLILTLWLAVIGVLPWVHMRFIVFVVGIFSKYSKHILREQIKWAVRYE